MAKQPKKEAVVADVTFMTIERRTTTIKLLGASPLLLNRMSEKVKRELLYPRGGRLNAAAKATNLKHDPLVEFRQSVYKEMVDDRPTRLIFPGNAFKKAIASAALDIPGAAKAQVGRWLSVPEVNVSIYGIPLAHSAVVRMADQKRTPDVRFRAIIPQWACQVSVRYATLLSGQNVMSLLAAAGLIVGIGDGRTEKGSLDFGQFEIVGAHNLEEWEEIVASGGRVAQDQALAAADFFDDETRSLVEWFDEERGRRKAEADAPAAKPKKGKKSEPEIDNDALAASIAATVAAKANGGKRKGRATS